MSRWAVPSLLLLLSLPLHAATFIVDDNGTASDAAIDGTCLTAGGVCTLRAAIEEANATGALDVIHFSGAMTIVESSLTAITQPVRLDGEANAVVIEGTPVTLDGTSDGSLVARLTISGSPNGGVLVNATNVKVAGNTISGNQFFGVRMMQSGATIGGTGDADGNVISGTTSGSGIEIYGASASVYQNTIGTSAHGIYVNASGATILGNTISGNGGNGIWTEAVTGLDVDTNEIDGNGGLGVFLNGASGALIQHNQISANNGGITLQDASGNTINANTIDGNTYAGIRIASFASGANDNTLTNNVVTGNGTGIEIIEYGATADRNRMSMNSVHDNEQTGVDLQNGGNGEQAAPQITCVGSDDSSSTFSGSLTSSANTTYRIEIFSNAACQSSSGRTYLGFTNVTTDAGGYAAINVTLPVPLPATTPITTTATDSLGNTSEYSSWAFVSDNTISVSSDYYAWEPDGYGTIYASHAAVPEGASVDYAITNGTAVAPGDYTAISGTITFGPCETFQSVNVPVVDDNIDEPNETATITFSNVTGGATINATTASFIIEDDDATPIVTLTPPTASIAENGGSVTLTFALDHPSSSDITVPLTFGGTAGASDYAGAVASITIPALQTSATLTLTAVDDAAYEGDETIDVNGSVITIVDDDPVPAVAVDDRSVIEGNSGTVTMTFTVTLSNPSASAVTVDYATADVTTSAGIDYLVASGQLTFNPGETSKTIDVIINGDLDYEPDETFALNVDTMTATGTILNDETQADLSITKAGPAAVEPNVPFDYVITVTNAGPDAATNVTVTDALPSSVALDTIVATQGSCSGTTTVVCNLGTLANDASTNITLTVHATIAGGRIANTATVSGDQGDPTANASTANVTVSVAQVPALSEWMLIVLAAMLAVVAMRRAIS